MGCDFALLPKKVLDNFYCDNVIHINESRLNQLQPELALS
jgi:hypothetical protein